MYVYINAHAREQRITQFQATEKSMPETNFQIVSLLRSLIWLNEFLPEMNDESLVVFKKKKD